MPASSGHPLEGAFALFVLWAFAWEVGCRNIPNDWSDLEEDIHLGIRTVPVRYGRRVSAWISFSLLCVTVASSLLFPFFTALGHPFLYMAGAAAAGGLLLIAPAALWLRRQTTQSAMFLFNRACFYPLAVFAVTAVLAVV